MKCKIASSVFATLLISFCTVEWAIGVPLLKDGNSTGVQPTEATGNYEDESSNYVIVDDMIINRDSARAGLIDAAWPEGVVPYTFAYTIAFTQKSDIMWAMNQISNVSCVKFRPATPRDTYNIEFKNDPMNQGCSSFVGWQNRKNQPVQLSTICSKGNAIHEIYHALGFFHEQTRNDRDDYVTVNYQNIQPGFEGNFKKDSDMYPNSETGYFGVPYNYDSIMHYGKQYFSKNQQNTIDVKENPDVEEQPIGSPENLGQRDFISEGDIKMLRAKYNCDAGDESESETETAGPGGEEGNVDGENEETTAAAEESTTKPTTKNPMCQYNPSLPMCKQ